MESRLWISPNNDIEAKAIIELLKRNNEDVLVTKQQWGASWENLEEEIKAKIQEAKDKQEVIYGIELQGDFDGAINIDHHKYGDDDRSNSKSSIEQVADILGVELSLDERFISEDDKGYIPAMKKLGKKLGISDEDLQEIIDNIRMRDREMNGITPEHEAQAEEAIQKLGDLTEKRDYVQVDLPHSKSQTIQDRLHGKVDNMLIISEDGETNFYGVTEIINMLKEKFPEGWSGGPLDEEGYGFWGGYVDQEAVKREVQNMIDKMRAEKNPKKEDNIR